MMRPTATNRVAYDNIAHLWDDARRGFSGREREYLDTFLSGLSVPSAVLDLGCGTGRPLSEVVIEKGHSVTGVDQSREMLSIAHGRFPDATWVLSPIEQFNTDLRFSGVVCWDALFHIPRELHEDILRKIVAMLLPDGRLMMTVGGSEHPAFTDTMFGQTFYYDSFSPERVLSLLANLGFRVLQREFMNLPTGGRDKGRYAIVAELT